MAATPRERAIAALELKPPRPGLVPACELEYQLGPEKFGRDFHWWEDLTRLSRNEQQERAIADADLFVDICTHYDLAFLIIGTPTGAHDPVEWVRVVVDRVRQRSGDRFLLIVSRDGTLSLPSGSDMAPLVYRMTDDRKNLLRELGERVDGVLENCAALMKAGLDGFALCADYCYNSGPWLSPVMFAEFVTPFLQRLIDGMRSMGAYTIKHTDGNILPIIDQLLECRPHALHSLDPQAGVDIREVKAQYARQVCLIGNVMCSLLQTGTRQQIIESTRYCLEHGMPGGGYIFSTSNVAFRGMPPAHFDLIHDVRRRRGLYPGAGQET